LNRAAQICGADFVQVKYNSCDFVKSRELREGPTMEDLMKRKIASDLSISAPLAGGGEHPPFTPDLRRSRRTSGDCVHSVAQAAACAA